MTRINLLPWRAERRKQRQKDSMVMLAMSAIAAVVLSFLIIAYYNSQISGQTQRNAFLTAQIAELDKQIVLIEELDRKKAKLLARKEVIEVLQANRSQMVHLFDSLVRTIPDGVVLTSIKQDDQTLTLEGRSQSNARVSTYLRSLEGSGWMTRPELAIIEATGNDKGLPYAFTLQVKLANPNTPTDENGDGIPDTVVAGAAQPAVADSPAVVEEPAVVEAPAVPAATTAEDQPITPSAAPAPAEAAAAVAPGGAS